MNLDGFEFEQGEIDMYGAASEKMRIRLQGDWTLNGVSCQLPHLVQHLTNSQIDGMQAGCETRVHHEVSLAGIELLDVCGCQLLTIFVHNLKKRGATPLLIDVPDAMGEKIALWGFGRELGTFQESV